MVYTSDKVIYGIRKEIRKDLGAVRRMSDKQRYLDCLPPNRSI